MTSISEILAVFDPTRGTALKEQPAVGRAAGLAKQLGAHLEVFVCVYDQYLSGQRFFDSPGLASARDAYVSKCLEKAQLVAEEVGAMGVRVTATAAWDTPLSDGIVRRALASRADMVIKDTHRHAKLQRAIFTNTDWHLLRDCPVPLLLVKPGEGTEAGPVIAAVDPMHDADQPAELDRRILDVARLVSTCQGSELHLFHAYQTILTAPTGIAVGIEPVMLPVEVSEARIKEAHERDFRKLQKETGVDDDQAHLLLGDTRDLLLDLVGQLGASLVVMGVVSRSALQRLFIGSTAEQVLGDVACDVLVVKQAGFETGIK